MAHHKTRQTQDAAIPQPEPDDGAQAQIIELGRRSRVLNDRAMHLVTPLEIVFDQDTLVVTWDESDPVAHAVCNEAAIANAEFEQATSSTQGTAVMQDSLVLQVQLLTCRVAEVDAFMVQVKTGALANPDVRSRWEERALNRVNEFEALAARLLLRTEREINDEQAPLTVRPKLQELADIIRRLLSVIEFVRPAVGGPLSADRLWMAGMAWQPTFAEAGHRLDELWHLVPADYCFASASAKPRRVLARVTQEQRTERESTVRDYIRTQRAGGAPIEQLTRDGIAQATGVPASAVSASPAWKALSAEKKSIRARPLPSATATGRNEDLLRGVAGRIRDEAIDAKDWEKYRQFQEQDMRSNH